MKRSVLFFLVFFLSYANAYGQTFMLEHIESTDELEAVRFTCNECLPFQQFIQTTFLLEQGTATPSDSNVIPCSPGVDYIEIVRETRMFAGERSFMQVDSDPYTFDFYVKICPNGSGTFTVRSQLVGDPNTFKELLVDIGSLRDPIIVVEPDTPARPPARPPVYDGPLYPRTGFDKSTLESLILTLSWEPVFYGEDEVTDYEYKVYEGLPTSKMFPFLVDWTSTGNVLETDISLQGGVREYTIFLRAIKGDEKSQHAQIGVRVPDDIYSIVTHSESETPFTFVLSQNYPNPFNPATTIRYELSEVSEVRLAVYDLLGREVSVLVDGLQMQGVHTARFDATGLPSGSYVYRFEAAGRLVTRVMTLSR